MKILSVSCARCLGALLQEDEWALAAAEAASERPESPALPDLHAAVHTDADECASRAARSASGDESPLNAVWDEMRLGPSPLDAAHDRVYYPLSESCAERVDTAPRTWDALGAVPRQLIATTNAKPHSPLTVPDARLIDNVQPGAQNSPFQPRVYAVRRLRADAGALPKTIR